MDVLAPRYNRRSSFAINVLFAIFTTTLLIFFLIRILLSYYGT